MSSTSPRIEKGAALLDEARPGWDEEIDLRRLDLANGRWCVVGQTFGDFFRGLAKLDGDAERHPSRYGFITYGPERFGSLTRKWAAFIEARRRQRASA